MPKGIKKIKLVNPTAADFPARSIKITHDGVAICYAGGSTYMFSVNRKTRMLWPYWLCNVSKNGRICWGDTLKPRSVLAGWNRFWTQPFDLEDGYAGWLPTVISDATTEITISPADIEKYCRKFYQTARKFSYDIVDTLGADFMIRSSAGNMLGWEHEDGILAVGVDLRNKDKRYRIAGTTRHAAVEVIG